MNKEAKYYSVLANGTVRCELCPHHCKLRNGMRGICLTRINKNGILETLNYCRPVSIAIDPIEKKPLYHFYPGSEIFSMGPNGCTFKCSFCQNHEISQEIFPTREFTAEKIVSMVVESRTIGVAYTYSEPYIWFETIMDIAGKIHEYGFKNVMVTNGFMEKQPLSELLNVIDAMNIDIKSIRPDFYRRLCKAQLEPVLKTAETAKKRCHIEITNLVIPEDNDKEQDVRDLASYIEKNLGRDTPLHLSRYFPRHKMTKPSTPLATLSQAFALAKEHLDFVYVGNIADNSYSNTYCPGCGKLLVERKGYLANITELLTKSSSKSSQLKCQNCGNAVPIII